MCVKYIFTIKTIDLKVNQRASRSAGKKCLKSIMSQCLNFCINWPWRANYEPEFFIPWCFAWQSTCAFSQHAKIPTMKSFWYLPTYLHTHATTYNSISCMLQIYNLRERGVSNSRSLKNLKSFWYIHSYSYLQLYTYICMFF
jgi:hypothetical protein